ncbi:MAG TPA: glutamine--fructose-6-phosphate transaminase (isomerizing) [Dehalococcoidia bacterium]|nr:glutamine--fructose-6-phosphate transaminase (isomerizing) [Dehalococcoidia bacterium]
MCGIVGYTGPRQAAPLLLDGLRALEYRGYDSSGIALLTGSDVVVRRAVGKLDELVGSLNGHAPPGYLGIGHTRWATHGQPTETNAHPHRDCTGDVLVIHNGIVENYLPLKERLIGLGHEFVSQTDTEVIPHLIEEWLRCGHTLEEAVQRVARELVGGSAFLVIAKKFPDRILAAKVGHAGGIVIGHGEGEMFVASDQPALLAHTRRLSFLEDREIASITRHGVRYFRTDGTELTKKIEQVQYDPIAAAKGGYRHFMLKEIMEQPISVTNALRGRIGFEPPAVHLPELDLDPDFLADLSRVVIVACGTSYYSGLVGKFLIEEIARVPVEVDYGSEFRYRDPIIGRRDLLVSISQSGETADTLAAMESARGKGVRQITICNVKGSAATRLADSTLYLNAGPEIGVASTKAFTSQVVVLYLLATYLGQRRGTVGPDRLGDLLRDLTRVPELIGRLVQDITPYEQLANQFHRDSNFLYLGRGINYPIALEGALKLKEISYIHAEGYPAGEMKHGPIALVDQNLPVVAIAPRDDLREKMVSNIEQVKARGGTVIALVSEGDSLAGEVDAAIELPEVSSLVSPLLSIIPLQLLAYSIALRRGCDVDQPRNLAKSVTVE